MTKSPGDGVYSGSTVKQGEIDALVIATGVHTFFGKAAHLVDSTNQVGHFQKVSTMKILIKSHPLLHILSYILLLGVFFSQTALVLCVQGLDCNRKFLHMFHCSGDDH